jgi:DNA-binding XRE family transcriptional regulator
MCLQIDLCDALSVVTLSAWFYFYKIVMEKEIILKKLGARVKSRRSELSISQEELAFKCGFDRTYISLVERGLRNISFINLLTLAQGLEITISSLTQDINGTNTE